MKKLIAFTLCLATVFCAVAFPAAAEDSGITPYYNNTSMVNLDFVISNDVAKIKATYNGYPGITTGATVTVKLQKRTLWLFWSNVSEWTDSSSSSSSSFEFTESVGSGTYRVKVEYTIYGSGGNADVITKEKEVSN